MTGFRRHLWTLLLCALPLAAGAADATRGRVLYQDYCTVCHGSNPAASEPVGVAYNPDGLAIAINRQARMRYLADLLDYDDLIDITEYIGSVSAPRAVEPQTGWYWNAAESGRGFFIEKRGNNAFMAGFQYDASGRASWFTSQGAIASSKLFAPMSMFANGQTLTGPYQAPQALSSPGTVGITFNAADAALMNWPGGTTSLVRFPFAGSSPTGSGVVAPQAGAPESGWWWNPDEPGRGYAIEFQGDRIFLCGFMYDADGNPIWYLINGTMAAPNRFEGAWMQFANGQAMGAPYRAPTLVNAQVGAAAIEFSDARNATLTLPDGRRIALTRFVF
jgi:hypothetical protein